MPTVPTMNPDRVQQAGLPGFRESADAPLEAFGGGNSVAGVAQATQGLGDEVRRVGLEEKYKADQVAFMSADQQAADAQTKWQIQGSQMLGKDAGAAPDVVSKGWNDDIQKIRQSLTNPEQQFAFDKSVSARQEALNKSIQIHVADQAQKYDDNETSAYISTSRNNAVLNAGDDQAIGTELNRQAAALQDWATRKGIDPNSQLFKDKLTDELSQTHADVINARLGSGQDKAAIDYFNANKAGMSAKDVLQVSRAVDHADTVNKGMDMWNKVRGFELSDGTPDMAKMEASVQAMPGISQDKKDQIASFVKARASEQMSNDAREKNASDSEFENSVIKAKQQGQPLSEAMKLIPQYADDEKDQLQKTNLAQKIYAPKTESNPQSFLSAWEKVQDGNSNKAEIDALFNKGDINVTDYRALRETQYKLSQEGVDPLQKSGWQRVKLLADETFGSNKDNKEQFLYEMHVIGQDKSPEEIWKLANDKIKSDPNTGFMGFGQSYQFKTDVQKMDAQNLAWGKLQSDLGKDTVNAIGKGALYSGKKTWGAGDVDAFAANFGGYQAIKPGTPANNAMQSLMKNNQLVTPSNVKAVLQKYPNGKF